MFTATLSQGHITSNDRAAYDLLDKRTFGERHHDVIVYMPEEALFLASKKVLLLVDGKGKPLSLTATQQHFSKKNGQFLARYTVFRDLREKGYIVKSGLKFGAEFRIYNKNKKNEHATWLTFIPRDRKKIAVEELSARNRVAHSTKKKLLLCLIDDESRVTYTEINWIKP